MKQGYFVEGGKIAGYWNIFNWQDADSLSAKSFRYVFPDGSLSRIMLCGGHVGRSHANNLKDYKSKKSVEQSFIASKLKDYPQLKTAKCERAGERAHYKNCGCLMLF